MGRSGQKNTAELQLDGVRGNQLAADCIAHRIGARRQRARGRAKRRQPLPREVLLEEVLFLLPDRSPEDIARTLGYSTPASIARAMYRLGRRDVARLFERAAREQQRRARTAVAA